VPSSSDYPKVFDAPILFFHFLFFKNKKAKKMGTMIIIWGCGCIIFYVTFFCAFENTNIDRF